MNNPSTAMTFSILLKREEGCCIAHCLELDIVATADTMEDVKADMKDLIIAQVDYAFCNGNLDNLYRPAPQNVWKEYFECQTPIEEPVRVESSYEPRDGLIDFVPPWIIAKTCHVGLCHA